MRESAKIANIQFGYANSDMIKKLRERGKMMGKFKQKDLLEIEKELNEMTEKRKEEFQRPVTAFVTFRH